MILSKKYKLLQNLKEWLVYTKVLQKAFVIARCLGKNEKESQNILCFFAKCDPTCEKNN